MYRPRPLSDSKLECDICGKPAKLGEQMDLEPARKALAKAEGK